MPDTTTRWNVLVSREIDIAVHSSLAQRGMKRGDLSKFIEDAVRWRVLDQTAAEARAGFADLSPGAIEALANEALAVVRQARKAPPPKAR